MLRKSIALLLALVLCVGILAGCEQKPAETSKPTDAPKPTETQKPTETTAAPTEPPVTEYTFPAGAQLDIYTEHSAAMGDTMLNDFIEEATGLDLLWLMPPQDGGIKALLTEKVTPSLVFANDQKEANEMGRYGAYINLWDYQEYMPNFFAHFNSEKYAAYKEEFMLTEDELYAAPVYLNGDVQRFGYLYREDIFKELNLEVPTDWDSFYACLKALKAAYPDSYPFTMRAWTGNIYALVEFSQQFGVKYTANYSTSDCALDEATGKYYDPFTTDAMREMLKKIRLLIDEELMDVACLSYDTAMWQQAFTTGHAFITHDKAFQLKNLEAAGKQVNENFSLSWFNNLPMVESDLPYQTRDTGVQTYCWFISTNCADVELACRYLDWLYTEEGSQILSWGVEGKSYGVDADGNKYFLEGYDTTYQARYQESGYIDFTATLAAYDKKTQEMILDTMAAAAEGGFLNDPTLTFQGEDQTVIDTYKQGWLDVKNAWIQNFLLGKNDINSDAEWDAYKQAVADQHIDEIIAAYDAAYARFLAGN